MLPRSDVPLETCGEPSAPSLNDIGESNSLEIQVVKENATIDNVKKERKKDERPERQEPDPNSVTLCGGLCQCFIYICIVGIIICIYVFSNIDLVKRKRECEEKRADNQIIVNLYRKDNWYVFRYNNNEWNVPRDPIYSGKLDGTPYPAFISNDGEHFSLSKDTTNCDIELIAFNVCFTLGGLTMVGCMVASVMDLLIFQFCRIKTGLCPHMYNIKWFDCC